MLFFINKYNGLNKKIYLKTILQYTGIIQKVRVIKIAKPPKKYNNLNKEEIKFIKNKLRITQIQDIDTAILKEFKESLKTLKDSRKKYDFF